jgi:hypothetical protein
MSGIDRTADMTSNTAPSPNVASASSEDVGTEAWLAFDKVSGVGTWKVTSGTTGWLKYYFGSGNAWASNEYRITAKAGELDRLPKDFTFQGSNNDSTWTTLDTRTGITFSASETKTFTFTNITGYTYYKIDVTAINAGVVLEIPELGIYAPSSGGFFAYL